MNADKITSAFICVYLRFTNYKSELVLLSAAETNQQSQVMIQNNNGSDYKPTGEILTAAEIRDRYPREWVLIADTESDDLWNVSRGEVKAHSPQREEIDRALTN